MQHKRKNSTQCIWISMMESYDKPQFSSVQSLSHVQLFATPWTAAHQASLSITNSQSLLKLMSVESVMPFNHLILCRPLLLPPSIFPSIRVFSNKSVLHMRWPKYWTFSFSISPSNKYSGLISFRIDWFNLLAVFWIQESSPTPKFKSKNSSVPSFLYGTTLNPYMATRKTIALARQTNVGKVMSLHFNMLSGLVIAFLPRSKCVLISWLQSPSAVILAAAAAAVSLQSCPTLCDPIDGSPPGSPVPRILQARTLSLSLFPLFSHLFGMKWWEQMPQS